MFIKAKDDGGGGDNWTTGAISRINLHSNSYHQQTNIQFYYRPNALPVTQRTVSKHWRQKYHIPWTCLPQTGVFQLCLWPFIAPGYLGEGCHASHQPILQPSHRMQIGLKKWSHCEQIHRLWHCSHTYTQARTLFTHYQAQTHTESAHVLILYGPNKPVNWYTQWKYYLRYTYWADTDQK